MAALPSIPRVVVALASSQGKGAAVPPREEVLRASARPMIVAGSPFASPETPFGKLPTCRHHTVSPGLTRPLPLSLGTGQVCRAGVATRDDSIPRVPACLAHQEPWASRGAAQALG